MSPHRRRCALLAILTLSCGACGGLSFVLSTFPPMRTSGCRYFPIMTERNVISIDGGSWFSTVNGMPPSQRRSSLVMIRSGSAADGTGTGTSAVEADVSGVPIPMALREGETSTPRLDSSEEGESDEKLLSLDCALEVGVNRALRGDASILRQVLGLDAVWAGPLGQIVGLAAIERELRGLGQLLLDPRMSVFSSKKGAQELEWVASGTWPLPWRPRLIVRGKSNVKTSNVDGKISEISDKWDGNLVSLALKHLVPGFWDIWHQLGSPPAEKQPYAVLRRGRGYEIREYVPRLSFQPSIVDRTQEREMRKALILPDFSYTGDIKTSGRQPDEYFVTSPIEVAIQPFVETGEFPEGRFLNGTVRAASKSRRVNRITWSVTVPTAFGLDPDALPLAPTDLDVDSGERASVVRQEFRRIAVAPFNGLPQDIEASEVRGKLLAQLAADGIQPKKGQNGRILNGVMMYNACACFNKKAELGMAILYYRPPWIGIGNEVYVEVEDRRKEDA